MQRPYNDRWERTRRYLLRNLYHIDLSPIPEETRSDSSDDRPYSPLPDLIIEREPNRHDHSEEFYEALAVRMRRYYKRLFIDGVSEHELNDAYCFNGADDISEFEVNQSMASTFIIDTNNRVAEDEGINISVKPVTAVDFHFNINEDKTQDASTNMGTQSTYLSTEERSAAEDVSNVTGKKRKQSGNSEPSFIINTQSINSPNTDTTDVNDPLNISEETQVLDKRTSETIDTESDLVQYHRTSTTVAQVHDAIRHIKSPRVFEDGSPVLMPRVHELNRRVFGNLSHIPRNILVSFDDDDVVEDHEKGEREEIQEFEKITQTGFTLGEPETLNKSKIIIEALDSDLEVEWLMKGDDSISNPNQESIETCEEEEGISEDNKIERNQTPESTNVELVAFDDEDHKAIGEESALLTSESNESIQVQSEESIGSNEFDRIELSHRATHSQIYEDEIFEPIYSSFEMAIRKGLFESKNVRKTSVVSSDEAVENEIDQEEEFEPVEVMRGTMQTKQHVTLRRESTISNESPLPATFATRATAEEIEENNSNLDDNQINASGAVMAETLDEDQSLQKESSASQDDSISDVLSTHSTVEEHDSSDDFDNENESSKDADKSTPSDRKITSIAGVCNDVWSVSPVNINFEEFLQNAVPSCENDLHQKKRVSNSPKDFHAPMNKKKKYNNIAIKEIAIQTGAPNQSSGDWDCVKKNFFVGNPLVFRLCSCRDHNCS